jgi:hypothetical protein
MSYWLMSHGLMSRQQMGLMATAAATSHRRGSGGAADVWAG